MEVLSTNPFEISSVMQEKEVTSQRKRIQVSASGESCIGVKVLANACFKMSFVLPVEELCDILDERVSAGPSGAPDQRPVCGDPEIRSLAGREEGISNALVSEEESGCLSNCTWQWSPVWRDLTESLWGSDGCLPWPKNPGKIEIYSNFYRCFGYVFLCFASFRIALLKLKA